MRKILITFGGSAYDEITAHVHETFRTFGADEFWVYDDRWLDGHEFRKLNSWLWDHQGTHPNAPKGRGFGWYAWKPLIILDAMSRLQPGDVVCYLDADSVPIANISIVFETAARDGAMLFRASAHQNFRWCKRDTFKVMGLDRFWGREDQPAGCARWAAFKVGDYKSTQLLYEWLTYSINPLATTFDPSVLGDEHPKLEEHRTEQAILTLLALKYGYTLWREADQDGVEFIGQPDQPGDYPQLFRQIQKGGPHPLGAGSRFRNVEMPK